MNMDVYGFISLKRKIGSNIRVEGCTHDNCGDESILRQWMIR